ncbi:MAG: ABC transporter ATP-binding protein/permease, partial [Clostridiales bacterium]|nr:ABC transporter ATP-binding protein/permease [Clostridiales bacterium]
RLYEFESGQILLNGTDIREMDPNNLRENVAYCTQNVQLLHGTLRENITLYDRRYADREIYGAIEKLNLTEWFSGFPNGLDTGLEMGENNLSAGEAQLVTLVRLALKNPKLVLLDEITSRLDAATERRLSSAVEALCRDRTVVLIAHSQAAVGWMDRILYMRNGRLYENPQDGQEGAGTAYESKQ